MKFYRLEIQDEQENLLESYSFKNYQQFYKKYMNLCEKAYKNAVLYAFIGDHEENLREIEDMRYYYTDDEQLTKYTTKTSGSIGKILFYIILYVLITPLAIVIKLGKK